MYARRSVLHPPRAARKQEAARTSRAPDLSFAHGIARSQPCEPFSSSKQSSSRAKVSLIILRTRILHLLSCVSDSSRGSRSAKTCKTSFVVVDSYCRREEGERPTEPVEPEAFMRRRFTFGQHPCHAPHGRVSTVLHGFSATCSVPLTELFDIPSCLGT